MVEKKYHYQDSDSLYAKRKEDEQAWSEFGELAQETFKDIMAHTDGTAEPATSFETTGRGCVQCGDTLVYFEEGENGNVLLECVSCKTKQWNADIIPYSKEELREMDKLAKQSGMEKARHLPDELFRTIPDSLVNEYVEMRKRRTQGG